MDNYDSLQDTLNHIDKVAYILELICHKLYERGKKHDNSKTKEPEKPIFDEYTPKLKNCTYNSDEYKKYLGEMGIALKHHYKNNRHHPEYFENLITDMTLVDLIEMLCDWKAATLRHNDGDILKSIEINQKRFGYSDELKQIFLNTVNDDFNEIDDRVINNLNNPK